MNRLWAAVFLAAIALPGMVLSQRKLAIVVW